MKKLNLLLLISFFFTCSVNLFAVDRVVQQNGPVGTYSSITAAITAAVDGDNIVINNRIDGLPWLENITINKSLTFVSAVDNVQWWMEGGISITMAENRQITLLGMRNTNGSISRSGTVPVNRTIVNILYCDISGNILMSTGGINLYLGSTKAQAVEYSYGKIYGNDLRYLYLYSDVVSTEDVNQIIGNRLGVHTSTGTSLYLTSNSQYLYFSNNYVKATGTACTLTSLKSGSTMNRIINSTFTSSSTFATTSQVCAYDDTHNNGPLTVENCVFAGYYNTSTTGANGIKVTNPSLTTFTYNMYYHPFGGFGYTLSSSLNNFISSSAQMTNITTDGAISTGTAHVNTGNPLNDFLDLDLSRNDIGVFGGSYSMANFIPLVFNGESSRTNWMNTPRVVNQGGTVNVQVLGFDK